MSDEQQQTAAALGLLQRLPPQEIDRNLHDFKKVAPHLEKSLEPYVNQPFQVKRDAECNKFFVACEYNADGGTHRSPWTDKYYPQPKDETVAQGLHHPSDRVRRLEEQFNTVFDSYKTAYYDGGVSSVYLWDLEEGFAGVFVIRKELLECFEAKKGLWESSHVLEVRESPSSHFAEYKLSSTVRLDVCCGEKSQGETQCAGVITRQAESRCDRRKKQSEDMHMLQLGRMIEEMEISIRQSLDSFYIAKQPEILNSIRGLDVVPKHRIQAKPQVSDKPRATIKSKLSAMPTSPVPAGA